MRAVRKPGVGSYYASSGASPRRPPIWIKRNRGQLMFRPRGASPRKVATARSDGTEGTDLTPGFLGGGALQMRRLTTRAILIQPSATAE